MIEDYILHLNGLKNARSLSYLINKDGKRIKNNLLIRSDKLSKIDIATAKSLKDDYNLVKVIDFRSENEYEREPNYIIDDVSYVHIHLVPNDQIGITKKSSEKSTFEEFLHRLQKEGIEKSNEFMINTYKSLIRDYATSGYKKFFDELINTDGTILWHCSAGKDRAGFAAILVLYVLDFNIEDIIEDYLYTNVSYQMTIDSCINHYGILYKDVIECVFGVKREYLTLLAEEIYNTYGSMNNYLINGLGLDDNKIKILKDKFLED